MNSGILYDRRGPRIGIRPTKSPKPSTLRVLTAHANLGFRWGRQKWQLSVDENVALTLRTDKAIVRHVLIADAEVRIIYHSHGSRELYFIPGFGAD